MKKGTLAVIKLIPDYIRDEKLNIGLVYHSPTDGFLRIKFTKKLHRVKSFHDEMDMDFYRMYTQNIIDEFTPSIFNKIDLFDEKLIEKLSYNYVNTFYFSIRSISILEDMNAHFEDLFNTLVYYDEKIKNRPSTYKRNRLIAETYYNDEEFSLTYSEKISGRFKEKINFDFKINNVFVRIFEFNDSNLIQMIDQVKVWVYNSKIIEDKFIFIVEDNIKSKLTNRLIHELNSKNNVYKGYDNDDLIDFLNSMKYSDDNKSKSLFNTKQ